MSDAGSIELPAWAAVTDARRAHIGRVVTLLDEWALAMSVPPEERCAWRDAGRWHDALRDASEPELRSLVPDIDYPADVLHGPAAARRLAEEGEAREDVLDAIRYHTVGNPWWGRTGRALYMADFLEPGRRFDQAARAALASRAAQDFEGVFRDVVRRRIEWALREGYRVLPDTVALWNSIAA